MTIEQDLEQEQLNLSKKLRIWLEKKLYFQPVIDEPVLHHVRFDWTSTGTLYIGCSGTEENLLQVFRALAKHGFRLRESSRRPEANQPEWKGTFVKPIGSTQLEIREQSCSIYVTFCSTVCRREQVGTEMQEVPIFKIVCGDEESQPFPDDMPF